MADEDYKQLRDDIGIIKQKLFNGFGERIEGISANQKAISESLKSLHDAFIEHSVEGKERTRQFEEIKEIVLEDHGFIQRLKGLGLFVGAVAVVGALLKIGQMF